MKKILIILLVNLLFLTGCNNVNQNIEQDNNKANNVENVSDLIIGTWTCIDNNESHTKYTFTKDELKVDYGYKIVEFNNYEFNGKKIYASEDNEVILIEILLKGTDKFVITKGMQEEDKGLTYIKNVL